MSKVALTLLVLAISTSFATRGDGGNIEDNRQSEIDFLALSNACDAFLDGDGPFGKQDPADFIRQRGLYSKMKRPGLIRGFTNLRHDDDTNYRHPIVSNVADERFDWQDVGAVSRTVHDQGSLGTCAAFAATANIEGQRFLNGDGIMENLSVEQIIECSADSDKSADEADCGVFGGWPKLVLEYAKRRGGIASEADWPYCAGTLSPNLTPACFPCMPDGYSRESCDDHDDDFYCNAESTIGQNKLNGWCTSKSFRPKVSINDVVELQDADDEETLKRHLTEIGPLAVTISIGPLQFYRRGILDPPSVLCPKTGRPDHVVLLTGYGVEKGKPYWRLKNSWGYAWGEKGYFRLARGKNSCGIGKFQVVTAKGIKVIHNSNLKDSGEASVA